MEINEQSLAGKIFQIRNQQVILDVDLAILYNVETRALKQAVRRNAARFPLDFMFELRKAELQELITICDNLPQNIKFSPAMPYAFSELCKGLHNSVYVS